VAQAAEPETILELVYRIRAVDEPRAVTAPDELELRLLARLGQLPGDRFENVGERHDALGRAVLVDDDGHLCALLAEVVEEVQHVDAFRNDERRSYEIRELHRRTFQQRLREVLDVYDADRVVDRLAANRIAGRVLLRDRLGDLRRRGGHVEPDDLLARRHD